MADLESYIKHFNNNGPEYVLETGARDSDISDADYDKLWLAIHGSTQKLPAAKRKLRDRDYALEVQA